MWKGSWIRNSIHNMESGNYAIKTSTVYQLKEFCGRNADSVHNMEITFWHFPKYGKYNMNFHIVEITMKIFHYAV